MSRVAADCEAHNSSYIENKSFIRPSNKMNFSRSMPCLNIDSIYTEMDVNAFCASPVESFTSGPLDVSKKFAQELTTWGDSSSTWQYDYGQSPQSGRRCGIIFVQVGLAHSASHSKINDTVGSYHGFNNRRRASFLVVKGRASNIWSFPKGRMKNEEETEEICALREVFEETGIVLTTTKDLPRIMIGRNVYFIYHTTQQAFSSFQIHDNFEVGEVAWKTSDELRKMSANKDIRAVLRYPNRICPYHRLIYSPPRMQRIKYSFKDVTKYINSDLPQKPTVLKVY
jgi:8-oxo-dGTP pyrophosphatase MutT (NUDIX family)